MTPQEIESKIRTYLKDEFVMDQIDYLKTDDNLTLDSLAKAELTVYLADEFGVELAADQDPDRMFGTLGAIVETALGAQGKVAASL